MVDQEYASGEMSFENSGGASASRRGEGEEKAYEFSDLSASATGASAGNLDFILDIPLEITVELGRTRMVINDLLKLCQGSIIELSKLAGETLEILANQRLIARGEVVVVNEKYGIRITEIMSPRERIASLK
jgi:flagellar motor switch protein FliN